MKHMVDEKVVEETTKESIGPQQSALVQDMPRPIALRSSLLTPDLLSMKANNYDS